MRYSTEPRKYVKGYRFLSFARRIGDKYGKKLIDTATKTGMNTAKAASNRVVQKTAEATRDLIGNKIADKITSIGKPNKNIQKKFRYRQKTTPNDNNLSKFATKNGWKFMINRKEITALTKKLELKLQC